MVKKYTRRETSPHSALLIPHFFLHSFRIWLKIQEEDLYTTHSISLPKTPILPQLVKSQFLKTSQEFFSHLAAWLFSHTLYPGYPSNSFSLCPGLISPFSLSWSFFHGPLAFCFSLHLDHESRNWGIFGGSMTESMTDSMMCVQSVRQGKF